MRWSEGIFDSAVQDRAGTKERKADSLSRIPLFDG
jgi:hypothetical protein